MKLETLFLFNAMFSMLFLLSCVVSPFADSMKHFESSCMVSTWRRREGKVEAWQGLHWDQNGAQWLHAPAKREGGSCNR